MRANALLSPHRARRRPAEAHDRSIVTAAPNLMWATDATQVTTVRDGKVWSVVPADVNHKATRNLGLVGQAKVAGNHHAVQQARRTSASG